MSVIIGYAQGETTICTGHSDAIEIECDAKGNLSGTIDYKSNDLLVQQFRWNKWITWDTLKTKDAEDVKLNYLLPKHTGMNLFRIYDRDNKDCKSKGVVQITLSEPSRDVEFAPKKPINEITFTEKTDYEIFNELGTIVSQGNGSNIDIKELKHGLYYLCYDNKMENFTKKK